VHPVSNKIKRTLTVGSSSCNLLAAERDALWIGRWSGRFRSRRELARVDTATGKVRTVNGLPSGLSVNDLAVLESGDTWAIVGVNTNHDGRAAAKFGTRAGLLRVDRQRNQFTGPLVPTGTGQGLLGATGASVWLFDSEGAIVQVGH
jgi:hypothetical protein